MCSSAPADPKPACAECQEPLVLEDASGDYYYWRYREPFCKGARVMARSEQHSEGY
ncbi:hypothetical protein J7355_16020 [Endozoicomonas sp. G2_2]|jgi:hypothetical protein|uniref:hypothetical protein n=1 Tax=Endozoicomonas sp. G2_2 TaxID=2821092 RepID=UPI001AD99528|nr:hypothetical protein [Endozoicomonas sp. G2_2]MBO9471597.1 hypothetical protein [Endozoicomonas sp. G2_2]